VGKHGDCTAELYDNTCKTIMATHYRTALWTLSEPICRKQPKVLQQELLLLHSCCPGNLGHNRGTQMETSCSSTPQSQLHAQCIIMNHLKLIFTHLIHQKNTLEAHIFPEMHMLNMRPQNISETVSEILCGIMGCDSGRSHDVKPLTKIYMINLT
jgi:hypothetical protein